MPSLSTAGGRFKMPADILLNGRLVATYGGIFVVMVANLISLC